MDSSDVNGDGRTGARAERVHLEDYWRVVRRRLWLVGLTTTVALAAAAWAASQRPQLYRASLTLQVGDPRGRTGQLGDIDVSPNLLWTDPVESELQQLTTQAVAEYVVDSLRLRLQTRGIERAALLESVQVGPDAPNRSYALTVSEDRSVAVTPGESETPLAEGRAAVPLSFGGLRIVVDPRTPPGRYGLDVVSRRAAQARVTGGLAASSRPETNLIDVTYTDSDRVLATRVLNTVGQAVRQLGVQRIRDWAESRTEFIGEQLEDAGRELQGALEAVENYKEQRGLTSLTSEETRLLNRLGELQSRLEQLVIERNIYDNLIGRIRSGELEIEDIQQIAVVSTTNRAVQFYFERLLELLEERANQVGPSGKDPSHPEIQALDERIVETEQRLLGAAENATDALQARIDAVSSSLSDLRRQLQRLPSVETELTRLQNQVEIRTDMYKFLLSRYQESQIAAAEISPYVEIVDPADWARPVSGTGMVNIVFGGLVGLLLGLGGAFFLEYLDRSIQSTGDVEDRLGIPVLGWIPRMESQPADGAFAVAAVDDPTGPATEAYRVLRTNLAFSTAREERVSSLLFTSPGPGEGKSTTAANLAMVLAVRGDRTLLVDADLRRGELHRAFDLLNAPGLTDLLVGDLDPREAIRPDIRAGLDLLPAGQRPPNPSELLGSGSMVELLRSWREEYRWIILDAPPALPVTDAAVLAAIVDATVLVLKIGDTDRRAASRTLQQFERIDARVVGAVLNEIRPRRSPDSYYVDYHYATQT